MQVSQEDVVRPNSSHFPYKAVLLLFRAFHIVT
ncbi:hypothetical protein K2D_35000 [Planctomycetes bacterium K2D]|nr:hypothetical protein K2D_35000 [Planctomycetes bacterium K2D]